MRARLLMPTVAAGAVALLVGWGMAAPRFAPDLADTRPGAIPVDTELVIAVDVSNSMDPEEQALQREGYILGLTSREFLQAVGQGANGRIAVTYFEWAAIYDQKIILPWRVIDGPATAQAVAEEIRRTPYRRAPRTSIYGALQFALPLFDTSGYYGLRRVIDVSGDGTNNMGPPVVIMRDKVLDAGITINGLPILSVEPDLDTYYFENVIGGPGAVMVPADSYESFAEAILKKLIIEIASNDAELLKAPLP
jgi:hypothetical protein